MKPSIFVLHDNLSPAQNMKNPYFWKVQKYKNTILKYLWSWWDKYYENLQILFN